MIDLELPLKTGDVSKMWAGVSGGEEVELAPQIEPKPDP